MTKPSKKTEWEKKSELVAMNIVYQMGDELKLDVETRQKTNDLFIDFAQKLILDLLHQRDNEIREWVDRNEEEMELSSPDEEGKYHHLAVKSADLLTYLSNREV